MICLSLSDVTQEVACSSFSRASRGRTRTCGRIRPESGCNVRGADLVEDVGQSAGDDALVLLNRRRHANRAHRVRLAAARLPVPAQDVTIIPRGKGVTYAKTVALYPLKHAATSGCTHSV